MLASHRSELPAWAPTAAPQSAGPARTVETEARPTAVEPWKVHIMGLSEDSSTGLASPEQHSDLDEELEVPPGLAMMAHAVAERAVEEGEGEADTEASEDHDWSTMLAASTSAWAWQQPGQDWWPIQQDMWSSAPNWLQAGDVVCFHGLRQTTSLNGVCATVECWDEASGRWKLLLPNGVEKFAKPENLAVVQAQAYSGFGNMADPSSWCWAGAENSKHGIRKGNAKGAAVRTVHSDTTAASSCEDGSVSDKTDLPQNLWTTVMMRNIPNDYTGTMLLGLLDQYGFYGKYTLVYLPMDYHRRAGFGYAFIDFITTEEAQRFRRRFEGFSSWGLVSHKICNVSWSDALQGLQAHIDRYRNSPVMHEAVPDEFKPMLFEGGKRIAFPPPTKSVRAPRLRKKDPRPSGQHMHRDMHYILP